MTPPRMLHRPMARRVSQGWMITFVDLLALCVAFFVLLHAMSAPKPQLWSGAARAFGERLGTGGGPGTNHAQDDPVDRIHGLLRTRLTGTVPVMRLPDRVLISLPTAAIIDVDGKLTPNGQQLATKIAETLAPIGSRIDITVAPPASEAARRPMQSWRLAFGQANAFAAALSEAGYGRRLAVLASGAGGRDHRLQIAVFEDKADDTGA